MPGRVDQSGNVNWAGEHWINNIRRAGETDASGMVSFYHTRYCEGGSGNVAFVDIAGDDGYRAVCTDNVEVARFFLDHHKDDTARPYGKESPIVDAEFEQSGDIRSSGHVPSSGVRVRHRVAVV